MKTAHECEYTFEFPVDKWNRPGGFYSMTDVPIQTYKKLTRDGTVLSKDSINNLYEVRDNADNFTVNVPMEDVKIIDHDRSDDPLDFTKAWN